MCMLFGILTLITALAIAGVAAWFSIVGLMLLFSGSAMSIAVMAGTLEVGKLLTASWLYRYWNETSIWLRSYLTIAVVILMVVTSIGIFGYLSKAAGDQASDTGDAVAIVERVNSQIAREENKITILEDRISSIGGTVDVSSSIEQQEQIRDGAWARVQGDINYNQEQIENVREQLKVDIAQQELVVARLDELVKALQDKGTEKIVLNERTFGADEIQIIDYGERAKELRISQQVERNEIKAEKDRLRTQASNDIKVFQDAIDNYRAQAQETITGADNQINQLRNQNSNQQDDNIIKIDLLTEQIDNIYVGIISLKDEKFDAEQKVRTLDREVGPIKYLAQMIYGSEERDVLDQAIRLFILMLVLVFDPLAVVLVIAANQTLLRYGINLESSGPPEPQESAEEPDLDTQESVEDWFDSHFEEDSRELYGDNMPDIEEITDEDYTIPENEIEIDEATGREVTDVLTDYDGKDKTFFESINEPYVPEVKNVDTQSTTDIVEQIAQTNKSEQDLNMILKGKTKSQLLSMAEDGGIDIPAQLSKAEIVANIILNYDSITKKKI
jgi:hypothetical protein